MKLIERRNYRDDRACTLDGPLMYKNAILYDVVVRPLGITIARYVGRRFGLRWGRRRLAVDCGRWAFLFWAFAPRTA